MREEVESTGRSPGSSETAQECLPVTKKVEPAASSALYWRQDGEPRQASKAPANTKACCRGAQCASVPFSRFCSAERSCCRKAAAIVMGIQSSSGAWTAAGWVCQKAPSAKPACIAGRWSCPASQNGVTAPGPRTATRRVVAVCRKW